MSHYQDSPLGRQDARLNITDLYVFRGMVGTVFILSVNSSVDMEDSPCEFHPMGQYAIKLDLDGDAVEDLTYRVTFAEQDHDGKQVVELRRLSGRDAQSPMAVGAVIATGVTDEVITGAGGLRLWAGCAVNPSFVDPTVLKEVGTAFKNGASVNLSNWRPSDATNVFAATTVNAIVLEAPDAELVWRLRETPGDTPNGDFTWRFRPEKRISVWASTFLATADGDWQTINRVGHPMIQPIFNPGDGEDARQYNSTVPADDLANYGERFSRMVAAVVAAQGTSADPGAYGDTVAALLLPDMLPYELGTPACYGFAGHNGRALTDNAPDVMFSLVTNSALVSGLTRESITGKLREAFPYLALPQALEGG